VCAIPHRKRSAQGYVIRAIEAEVWKQIDCLRRSPPSSQNADYSSVALLRFLFGCPDDILAPVIRKIPALPEDGQMVAEATQLSSFPGWVSCPGNGSETKESMIDTWSSADPDA
jgi:hypothetical protein